MGNTRLGGRHTESLIACVFGPVVNVVSTLCQALVSRAAGVLTSRQVGHCASSTRRRGPLSEVMSCERTKAESVYVWFGLTGTISNAGSQSELCGTQKFRQKQRVSFKE